MLRHLIFLNDVVTYSPYNIMYTVRSVKENLDHEMEIDNLITWATNPKLFMTDRTTSGLTLLKPTIW